MSLDAQTVREFADRLLAAANAISHPDARVAMPSVPDAKNALRQAAAELVSLVASVEALTRERDAAVAALPVEGWNLLMAERETIHMELVRYGIDPSAGIGGLLRHIYNNRDAAHAAAMLAIDGWQERAVAAEARVVALTDERDDAIKEAVDLARYATDVAAIGEAAYRITTTRANAAEARLLSLEEALRRYGWHREGCGYSGSGQPESCTCGFLTVLAASVGDRA